MPFTRLAIVLPLKALTLVGGALLPGPGRNDVLPSYTSVPRWAASRSASARVSVRRYPTVHGTLTDFPCFQSTAVRDAFKPHELSGCPTRLKPSTGRKVQKLLHLDHSTRRVGTSAGLPSREGPLRRKPEDLASCPCDEGRDSSLRPALDGVGPRQGWR